MTYAFALPAMFLDGDIATVANSPFIVPVFGTLMILGIVVASIWAGVRRREMESQERLAAIAQGLSPAYATKGQGEIATVAFDSGLVRQRNHARQAGIVLSCIGLSLSVFGVLLAWIVRERDVLVVAAVGLIPLAIGVGLLVDARLKSRELSQMGGHMGEVGAVGGELRPLH